MSKYSFLLQTEETEYYEVLPTLRLKKHGGWLVAEAIEQEDISRAQSQATIRAVQLAKRIASAKNIELDEAFAALQGGNDFSEMELLSDYTEETLGMLTAGTSVETNNARLVTTFIRTRGEGLVKGDWVRLEDWSMDDTKGMGRPLITKVMGFIVAEQESESDGGADAKKASKKKQEVIQNE